MSVFSGTNCDQLEYALQAAGWPRFLIPIMVAVSKAETGGTCAPSATNRSLIENSVGPLQINLRAHPDVSEECARDPLCAAQAAWSIYQSQGLSAWSVYVSGAYRKYLTPGSPVPGTATPSGTTTLSGVVPAQGALSWAKPVVYAAVLLLILFAIGAWQGKGVV